MTTKPEQHGTELRWWEKALTIAGMALILLFMYALTSYLNSLYTYPLGAQFLALLFWWGYAMLEWCLNSGQLGYPYPNWTGPFHYWYDSFRCITSKSYALKRCNNDQVWADMTRGPTMIMAFLFTHIAIPFAPPFVYYMVWL